MNVCFAPCPVVFDLDGTLIDSAPDIHACVNAVLRLRGVRPLTLDQVRGFVGGGVDLLWRRVIGATGLPTDAHRDLVASFMTRYHEATGLTRLYPNVIEALGSLPTAAIRWASAPTSRWARPAPCLSIWASTGFSAW